MAATKANIILKLFRKSEDAYPLLETLEGMLSFADELSTLNPFTYFLCMKPINTSGT